MSESLSKTMSFVLLLVVTVNAQSGGFGGFGGFGQPNDNGDPFDGSDNDGSDSSTFSDGSDFGFFTGSISQINHVLIAHAVIASLVWVVLMPIGASLLRLNINRPYMVRLHAIWQIFSFILYIVAAGMGIWLAQQSARENVWSDPHPKIGLVILVVTFFQPIWGFIHHRIYQRRSRAVKSGQSNTPAGRTAVGRLHLWIGRLLIMLGIINGGLGIRLASRSPFQTDDATRKAKIAYAITAAIMFLLYAMIVVRYEVRRKGNRQNVNDSRTRERIMMKDRLPTYDESQESLERERSSSG